MALRGPLRPAGERRLAALRPYLDHAPPDPGRIDRAVQHEAVGPAGEHLRVDGTQIRAVRGAQVGDLLLAQYGADDVHVPGGVAGGDVRELVAVPGTALVGDGSRPLDVMAERPRPVGVFDVLLGVRQAAGDRAAAADAARIEPDEVVLLADLLGHRVLHQDRHVQALAAGTAGVEEDRTVPLARHAGLHTGDGQLERLGAGSAVVQWDLDRRALERGGRRRVATVPRGLLVLESLQGFCRGCLCRGEGGEHRCRDPHREQGRHASCPHDGRSFRSTSRSERPFRVGGHERIHLRGGLATPPGGHRKRRTVENPTGPNFIRVWWRWIPVWVRPGGPRVVLVRRQWSHGRLSFWPKDPWNAVFAAAATASVPLAGRRYRTAGPHIRSVA